MIIEDDEKIRKIVADTLTKWKYEVNFKHNNLLFMDRIDKGLTCVLAS
ncbi:hypothetical protein [Peribacillus sp. RS7]